jgi:hypothetical protein
VILTALFACTPDPDLAVRELPLDGSASRVFFLGDDALIAVAGGKAYRIPAFEGPPEVLADDVVDAAPFSRLDQMLLLSTDGQLSLLFPDRIRVPLLDDVAPSAMFGSDDGRLAVWADQNGAVSWIDTATLIQTQLGISGHLLGLSDDGDQALVADDVYENWYLAYLSDAHLVPVRYPSTNEILDIELVARDPRYAMVFSNPPPVELVVADGDGNVMVDAYTEGTWIAGAFVPDGSAVLTLESDGDELVYAKYDWSSYRPEVRGRGALSGVPARTEGDLVGSAPAAASPDGRRLAVSTPAGVAILYTPPL